MRDTFRQIIQKLLATKTWDLEKLFIYYSFITFHFLGFFHRTVSNLFFCCVTVKTIYTTDSQCIYYYVLQIYSKTAWPFIELNKRIEVIQAASLTRMVRRLSEDLQDINVGNKDCKPSNDSTSYAWAKKWLNSPHQNMTITYGCKRKPKDWFRRRSLPWKICRCSMLIHLDVAGRYSFVIMPKYWLRRGALAYTSLLYFIYILGILDLQPTRRTKYWITQWDGSLKCTFSFGPGLGNRNESWNLGWSI